MPFHRSLLAIRQRMLAAGQQRRVGSRRARRPATSGSLPLARFIRAAKVVLLF
jgi:hypothetical protein